MEMTADGYRYLADLLSPSRWRRSTAVVGAIIRRDLRQYRIAKRAHAAWLRGPK